VAPIYSGLLPYYVYNRGGSRLFSRKSIYTPLPQLTADRVQGQFLRFISRIDPRLVGSVGPGVFNTVQADLKGIHPDYGLPVPLINNLYNTFVSVIGGNGRSRFLLGLKPRKRLEHFSSTLGLYLQRNHRVLPLRLQNSPLLIQDFASLVDSRYILYNGGYGGIVSRGPDAADIFFLQLEKDHYRAVHSVLTDIFRVARSIDLATLPRLGYQGLLAGRFYPGFHAGQTDIIARYILQSLSGYGGVKRTGIQSALPYLPYVRGLPRGLVSTIAGSDLRGSLLGLNLPGLSGRLTPGILRAAQNPRFITQTLLASLLHGVRYSTPQQGALLFRDVLANLLLRQKRFSAPRFTSFLKDPLRPFVLLNRVIIPNALPAISRIPKIRLLPLNAIISIQIAIKRGYVKLPRQVVVARPAPVVVRPAPVVVRPAPVIVRPTPPPFPSIVVSRVTLISSIARRVYQVLLGGFPVLTIELLQPVLQLLVERRVIPIRVLRTPPQLISLLETKVVPRYRADIATALRVATVPGFVRDSAFTAPVSRLAFGLHALVLCSHGYTGLPGSIYTSTGLATLKGYYGAHRSFLAPRFLNYGRGYYPSLIGGGLLARPLSFGSATLAPQVVTSVLSGLRPTYGPVSYHGLGTVLGYPGAAGILKGVDLTSAPAVVKALSFGGSRPVLSLGGADLKAANALLRPVSSTLFHSSYALSDLQFLFSFGVRDLRIPRSIYGGQINQLFRTSLTSYLGTRKPLVLNNVYNPAYLNLVVNRLLVDALTRGSLSPGLRLKIPQGRVVLRAPQVYNFYMKTLHPLSLRLVPPFAGELLSQAFSYVPQLRTVKPRLALTRFARYLGAGPFSKFRYSLTDGEFGGLLTSLRKQRYLPGFFNRYPARLQRYYLDNLFGSYAAYSLLHQGQFNRPLSHGSLYGNFAGSLVPSFFKGRRFGNIGDLFGAAPAYFGLCRSSYKSLPGYGVGFPKLGGGHRLVHVAPSGSALGGFHGKGYRKGFTGKGSFFT